MSDEPTLGEVVRRLDDVTRQLVGIVDRLERRDTYIEENFVRTIVYVEARKADQAMVANLAQDIGGLQKERDTDQNFRRQVLLGFAVGGVGWLLTIALFVITFVTRS